MTPSTDHSSIIIFQHLAKTAGTTFATILQRNLAPDQQLAVQPSQNPTVLGTWLPEAVTQAINALPPSGMESIRFIGGHLGFGVHRLLPHESKYVVIVRDPVERVLSGYYYSIPKHRSIEDVSLEEYVFRKRHYDLGINNYQTRVLSGLPELDPVEKLTTANARPITEDDFNLVLQHIEKHYLLVGITERFDEFLVLLAKKMRWPLSRLIYTKQNVTSDRPAKSEIPLSIVKEILRHNEFDTRLYSHLNGLFDSHINNYGPTFEDDLLSFRELNANTSVEGIQSDNSISKPAPAPTVSPWKKIWQAITPWPSKSGTPPKPESHPPSSKKSDVVNIYLHMAKTGGATLGAVLNKQFTMEEILLPGKIHSESALGVLPSGAVEESFRRLSSEQWEKVAYIPGHFMFGVHKAIPRKSHYITMLRHPVSRVISSYYYILGQPGIPVRQKILGLGLGLDEYIKKGIGLDSHNYQTRVLAGLSEADATWGNVEEVARKPLPYGALDLAKSHIDKHIKFIGITETFDEFLLLLKLNFGWPLKRVLYQRINETPNRPKIDNISTETIKLIEHYNQYDLEVYEHAKKNFEHQKQLWATKLNFMLPKFQMLNATYGKTNSENIIALQKIEQQCDQIDLELGHL